MSLDLLVRWNKLLGEVYCSDDKAFLFYSLVKMQRPARILEIGTGVGVCSLFMALAAKENGAGTVFTVDNGSDWAEFYKSFFTDRIGPDATFGPLLDADFFSFMRKLAVRAELVDHIRFVNAELSLADAEPLDASQSPALAEALAEPIDFVFCDIDHRPLACLGALAKFLPLLSPSASIFIDAAPTQLTSHLTLVETVRQLNEGKVPAYFLVGADEKRAAAIRDRVQASCFQLVPLVERRERDGNSVAWIRVEPANVFPYPLSAMRGMNPDKPTARLPGKTLEAFFGADPRGDQTDSEPPK
jgi:predicted O-methyltransferase YrrM